jgi:hypothetical protein
LPTLKREYQCFIEAINVPVELLKTWLISHQKSFLIINIYFGQEGAKNLAEDLEVPFLGSPYRTIYSRSR